MRSSNQAFKLPTALSSPKYVINRTLTNSRSPWYETTLQSSTTVRIDIKLFTQLITRMIAVTTAQKSIPEKLAIKTELKEGGKGFDKSWATGLYLHTGMRHGIKSILDYLGVATETSLDKMI